MILSTVRGDFKSFFGKKRKTWEPWKTDFNSALTRGHGFE